jgi:hypothetical protein
LQLLLVLASAVILGSESRGTYDHILLSQIRDFPNLEDQVPVFVSSRNRVVQLCPQALGSLFVASYDSQGYGGGIPTHLHAREPLTSRWPSLHSLGTDRIENTISNNSSLGWIFVTVETFSLGRYLAMDVFSGFAIPAFIRHVTVRREPKPPF